MTFKVYSILCYILSERMRMLEVHRRYEPGQGVLPPSKSAVVLVVAESVHDVHQDHDRQEDVEAGPGEQARPRPC